MLRSTLIYIAKVLFIFFLYFITARIGLSFDAVSRYATLVWFPSGFSLVILFLLGFRFWPAIFLAAFLANLFNGASPLIAMGIGTGNTLEAVIGAYILKRSGFRSSLDHLRDVLLLVFLTTPLSTAVSASIGVFSLFLGGSVSRSSLYPTWQAWWIGDMISFLILSPFLFIWRTRLYIDIHWKRIIEIVFLALSVIIIELYVFRGAFGNSFRSSPITYLVFPPLIWAALRFGQRGAVTVVFVLSIFAMLATIQGHSLFGSGNLSDRLLSLQSFMGVIAVTTMILAAIDTERRMLEERKDEFINLASHELKSPLTSLKAFLQILQKKFSTTHDTQVLYYMDKMDKQINKQTLLINSLLDLSKIQTGKLEFQKEYFLLLTLVNDTIEAIQASTSSHTIIIKNSLKKDSFIVYADKERINQVLVNLLTNAIKYSPKAKKVIVMVTKKQDKILVGVKDFGIGIPLEQQEKIFDRYYRGHENNEKTVPGLGLGLYISHEIIQLNEGDMWLKSKPGKGTTFYFALLIAQRAPSKGALQKFIAQKIKSSHIGA